VLKKTLKYKDFNDREREEVFYFHLSQPKLIRWNMIHVKDDGLKGYLQRVMAANDGGAAFDFIEKMILDSYGHKTDDGGFLQNDSIRSSFESSPAYAGLLMELITDADKAAAFLNGIIPAGFSEEVERIQAAAMQQEQRQPNRAERRHPSDTAAQSPPPGPRPAATSLADRIHDAEPVETPTPSEPRVLTRAELVEMDDADLRSGLAEGRYKLQ
jgi:hypothetical protein